MITYRQLKYLNSANFYVDIVAQPWDDIKQLYDLNDMWRRWKELFLNVCEKQAPMKTKWTQDSKSPWITAILKKQMNFRDRLKRKAIKTKDPCTWDQFRIVKNQVNWEINSVKKAYYENAFNNCCGDQRKTWKTINELTSRKSTKTVINEMEYIGVNSGDQTGIAEMLNSFFTEIGPGLSREVAEVDKSFEEFLTETDKNFVFEKTTPTHVFTLLSKLCKSMATGLDNISAKHLRECPDVLVESLTHLFN